MNQFKRWAEKEYSLAQRLLAPIPAGLLFAVWIPWGLVYGLISNVLVGFDLISASFKTQSM